MRRCLRRTAFLFAAGGLAVLGIVEGSSAVAAPEMPGIRLLRFSTKEGTWMSVDVSPDGRTLLFDHLGDIYLVAAEGGVARPLRRGRPFDSQPRFSPDGRSIVFISDAGDGYQQLWLMASDGSAARPLTTDRFTAFVSPSFSPDGRYVVASRRSPWIYSGALELWQYDVRGGAGIRLTRGNDGSGASAVSLNSLGATASTDGHRLFFAQNRGSHGTDVQLGSWQIVALDLTSGETMPVVRNPGGAVRPLLAPGGSAIAYATRTDGVTGIRLKALTSGEERWLVRRIDLDNQQMPRYPERDAVPGYAFSRDGASLFAAYGGQIHKVDVASGHATAIPVRIDVALEAGPRLEFPTPVETGAVQVRVPQNPRLSPDGRHIISGAFGSLYLTSVRDGRSVALLPQGRRGFEPAWSPDGKQIAFVDWDDVNGGSLWAVSLTSPAKPRRLLHEAGYFRHPAWTSDGRRVVFTMGPWQQSRAKLIPVDVSARSAAANDWDLVAAWVDARGGPIQRIGAITDGFELQPSSDGARVRLSSHRGIDSFDWNGGNKRSEMQFVEKLEFSTPSLANTPPRSFALSPDGQFLAALVQNKLYVMPHGSRGSKPLSLDLSRTPAPAIRLSSTADQFAWRGNHISWSTGTKFFERDVAGLNFSKKPLADAEGREQRPVATIAISRPRATGAGHLLLANARIVTMRGEEVVEHGDVLIDGGRIVAVGPHKSLAPPVGARVVDLTGKTLIPGFIDVHGHAVRVRRGVLSFPDMELTAFLAYGVTTIRDPQSITLDLFAYQDMVEAGLTPGPRIYTTGPGITWVRDLASLDEARDILRHYRDAYGVNTIKSYIVGNRQQRQWIAEASRELELMPTTEGGGKLMLNLTHAIDGLSIEHTIETTPLYDDVVQLLAQSGAFYDPTLLMTGAGNDYIWAREDRRHDPKVRRFFPPAYIDRNSLNLKHVSEEDFVSRRWAADAVKIARAGGRVSITSHGDFAGVGFHESLRTYVEGGATPAEALRAATIMPATAIGHAADLGSIEPGKLADLVVLDANPLDDIRNTEAIHYVVKAGIIYDGNTLAQVWPARSQGLRFWWSDEPYFAAPPRAH